MAPAGNPSAAKAFVLGLLAPPLGHSYAGHRRRAQITHLAWLALMGLAVALAMLPPVNLPVLVLMALPLCALLLLWLGSAVAAAVEAGKPPPDGQPAGLGSPVTAIAGTIVNLLEIAALAFLLYSLSGVGLLATPTDDMAPTTLQGDRLVTWKDYYDNHLPERGDVAVVQLPGVEGKRVMRIIGLPGDSLLGVLGVLNINGEAVSRDADGDFSWRDAGGTHRNAPRYVETLPGGVSYHILQSAGGMLKGTLLGASLRIPDGHYFVIGDNRDRSKSSWDFGMLPGLVLSDRPTVILSSSKNSLIGRSVQP
jgi:signal peptidase I